MKYFMILIILTTVIGGSAGEKKIFNGKDLSGWKGDSKFWKVVDGVIRAESTKKVRARHNTFLIWDGELPDHYEIKFKYKMHSKWANSGLQFHSKVLDEKRYIVGGLQADFEAGNKYCGILYEEKGRGIIAQRGTKVTIDQKGKKVNGSFPVAKGFNKPKSDGWVHYHIIFYKGRVLQIINGYLTVDVQVKKLHQPVSGKKLAIQLHTGPPMKMDVKDITLKELKETKESESYVEEQLKKIKNGGTK